MSDVRRKGALARARGREALVSLLKFEVLLIVGLVPLGLFVAVFPASLPPGATGPEGQWPLVVSLLGALHVAAFLAGVVSPWCDSIPRVAAGAVFVSQPVAVSMLVLTALPGWEGKGLVWLVWTVLGTAGAGKYLWSRDHSWREYFG